MTVDATPSTTFVDPRAGGLIIRTGAGDRTAFGSLYDLTAMEMFSTIRGRLGDRDGAFPATQRAYLDIWRRSPLFLGGGDSAADWLTEIAHLHAPIGG